jgi:hypothetical protein
LNTSAKNQYNTHDLQDHAFGRSENHSHPVGSDIFGITQIGEQERNGLFIDPIRQRLYAWPKDAYDWQAVLEGLTPDILRHIAEIFVWAAEHAEETEQRNNRVLTTAIEAYNKLTTEQKKLFATRT